jgi:hypothetical protein
MTFLTGNNGESFWIGANDIDIEYDWVWESDKSKLVFRYWFVGEPNSVNEDCATLRKLDSLYKWNDVPCLFHYLYICER